MKQGDLMGRPRSAGRRDLAGTNLELHGSGLYRYRRPDNGKYEYLSRDKGESLKAAKLLDAILTRRVSLVDKIIDPAGKPFRQVVEWFRDEKLPKLKLAAKTRDEKARMVDVLVGKADSQPIDEMGVLDCNELLAKCTSGGRARSIYRTLLVQIFAAAGARGWTNDNPASRTEDDEPEKQRLPLTLEWYRLIYAAARPSIQCAMDLALQTLQRREDVSVMEAPRDGAPIRLVQQKTGKALEIPVSPEIQAVIDRGLKMGVVCPFIVRMKPLRRAPQEKKAKGRAHFAQLVPEQLTRGFAEARDTLDVFKAMPPAKRPTFHEIRGLGGMLYKEKMGWTDVQVQALMGHEDVGMTRDYLEQHAPVYERVSAGLKL